MRAMSTRTRTKPIYHRSRNLTLLLGTYQRTCGLVGANVVKIFGNGVKITMKTKYKVITDFGFRITDYGFRLVGCMADVTKKPSKINK